VHNIKKYTNTISPTHFFDWVRVDFTCVLYILSLYLSDSIHTFMDVGNINVDKHLYAHNNDISITFNNFDRNNLVCLFHHEISINDYEANPSIKLKEFTDKYKRRFDRLINLIKSNDKLCFVHKFESGFDYEKNSTDFYNILTAINKDIKFCLVLLVETEETEKIIKHEKYIKINLSHFIDKQITPDWTRNNIDWKTIFELIEQATA
jgi:hypothetical protein